MKRTQAHSPSRRKRLTNAQAAAIPLLVGGATAKQVTEEVGVQREAVSRWHNNSRFRSELDSARGRAYANALDELRVGTLRATKVLVHALDSEDESMRVRAAHLMLRLVIPVPHALTVAAGPTSTRTSLETMTLDEAKARIDGATRALESATRAGGLTKFEPGLTEPAIGKRVDAQPARCPRSRSQS